MSTTTKKTYHVVENPQPRAKASPKEPLDDLIEQGAICPYYQRDRGLGRVYCECARFHFPDRGAQREIVYTYCAHPSGYKLCPIKQAMDHFYERKYASIEKDDE